MEDYTNDYRGRNNRYKVRKHNNLKKEKELHRIKLLSSRSPARSSMKNTLVTSYTYFDDNTTSKLDNDWEPVFFRKEDCLAFQLQDLIKTDDIEGIKTLLLYSDPSLLEKSINICGSREGWWRCEFCIRGHPEFCIHEYCEACIRGYCEGDFCEKDFCDNEFGTPALLLACFYGHLEVVRALIEIGKADINISDANWTPLRAAISQGHIDIVKYLIEQFNAIIDYTHDFSIAIISGHFDMIDYLLNQGCDPNARLMNHEYSTQFALHYTIDYHSKNLSTINTLLKHGSDPTIQDADGRTALWFACFRGPLEVVRTLIEISKTDINISDHENWTPLRAAISQGHIDIVKYLIEQFHAIIDDTHDFFIAIKYGDVDMIDYLLNQGCDPNACLMDDEYSTHFALHYTIIYHSKNLSTINTLLKYGSDPTIQDAYGRTALWFACFRGPLEVVRTLIEISKADINISDHANWTPLRAAISQGHIDIVKYLIEQFNAIIDYTHDFFIAIKSGHFDMIDYLLNQGCDPNARLMDENNCTHFDMTDYLLNPRRYPNARLMDHECRTHFALHYTIRTHFSLYYTINYRPKNLSTIKTLLKHGSDPTIKDAQGDTALHLAIQCQNKEIVQEILHYGFKHDQRDTADLPPLMLAMDMELEDILDIFYQILPRQKYIDEMMLLGCFYALKYEFRFAELNPRAFIFFEKGLKLQESNSNVQPCDIYKFHRECQTIDELRAIQFNPELMYIQALLVYERLLPQRNEISLLIPKLFTFYTYHLRIQDYKQCLLILIHLYPIILSCKENMFHTWDTDCLIWFVDLLNSLMINQDMRYIDYIIHGFKWTLNGLYSDDVKLCDICLCATNLIESNQIDIDTKCQLIRWIKEAIRRNYALNYDKDLFNQATIICLNNTHRLFQRISDKKFLHLLIYCGADANEGYRYRPLHQVALNSDLEHAQSVIETLITLGAHTDCLDYQGLLPEQRASNLQIRDFLYANRSRSLKCLCVQLIISKGIQYQSSLSDRLKNFILMHQSKK